MSGRLALTSLGLGALLVAEQTTAMLSPQRGIFGDVIILPDVVIEERGEDRLEITAQPVEQSANISDHAYKLPAEVILRWGFSDSAEFATGVVQENYDALLTLQAARAPFLLVTGKRAYPNMLIASIGQTTDAATEYALMVTIICQEVIFARTTTVQIAPSPSQARAPDVTGTVNNGVVTPKSAPTPSILKSLVGG